ncbi:hypothetical protein DSC45_29260 [Streptomyces sp. YIM 130001]|nr:hypothetical protein DSC45_29260 [Streptomyces sp. YIM 130001]
MPDRSLEFGKFGARGAKGADVVARRLDDLAGGVATPVTAQARPDGAAELPHPHRPRPRRRP